MGIEIEIHDRVPWIFRQRSSGELPADSLSDVLMWILQQLNFGHFIVERDTKGDGVSLTLGQAAAFNKPQSVEAAKRLAEERSLSVVVAGLFAKAREHGIEPEFSNLAEAASIAARDHDTGRMNTEFHYAFELLSVLRRIRHSTFVFDAPPILGRADRNLIDMLGEATRCMLFGLYRSSVSTCRAVMEAALESKVDPRELSREMRKPTPNGRPPGKIVCLIKIATQEGVLTEPLSLRADAVRNAGNNVMHRRHRFDEDETWLVLEATRQILEHVYSAAARK